MEKIKVSTFEGVDVTQGLIFLDEDNYDIRNILTVDHVIIEPRRSIYRVCIFGGLGLMLLKGFLAELGLSLTLFGIALWGLARPKHGVLVKHYQTGSDYLSVRILKRLKRLVVP